MPKLHQVEVHRLRPTQITVGLIEVHDKRDKLLSLKKNEQLEFLEAHPIPAVWGPDGKLYITDHHHLGRACCEAGVDSGFFLVEEDFSKVPIAQFRPKMAAAQWVHPIDQVGKARPFEDIPNHLEKLFRSRIQIGSTRADFNSSVEAALKLATSREAAHLPGYKEPARS